MRFLLAFLASCLVLTTLPARAEPPKADQVVILLGHEDPVVRREAARTLLRIGFDAEAALHDALVAPPKHVLGPQEAERSRRRLAELQRVGRAFSLAGRLAKADPATASFWIALDDAVTEAPPELLEDVLRLGVGDAERRREVLRTREAAAAAVATFVTEWNEMYTPGTDLEKRYDELKSALVDQGMASVPPLLHILEVEPRRAFLFVDPAPEGEVSARMQVRAIFALSFLGPREAVPYLVLHANGPSLTAASNAWGALVQIAGIEGAEAGFLQEPDRELLEVWWADHRHEYAAARRPLERALVDALLTSLAHEILGVAKARDTGQIRIPLPDEFVGLRQRQARLVEHLGRLSGVEDLAFDPEAEVERRLGQAQRIAVQVERARAE